MVYERCAAHPSHRGLDVSLRLRYCCVELGVKVPTLDVEPVLTRPLHGEAGVLSCTSAIEFRLQIFSPSSPHCWRVHRAGCAALTATLHGRRSPCRAWGDLFQVEEAVDVVTPLPQYVRRSRQIRQVAEQLPGHHQWSVWCRLSWALGGLLCNTLWRNARHSP
jgi:hypothetical protein